MAHVQVRDNGHFTGYFRDVTGKTRSAGTFKTEAEALMRAKDLEGKPLPPRIGPDLPLGTYEQYATAWLANEDDLEPRTKSGYETNLRRHVLPLIGHLAVDEISTDVVTQMLASLRAKGVGAGVRAQCKAVVGRSFRPLVPVRIPSNPTHGIRVDIPPSKPFGVLEPTDFEKIYRHLPNTGCKIFARFLVTSGCRFGEATEVRVHDLNFLTGEVSILRRSVQVSGRENHGGRFQILPGTKAGMRYGRTFTLPAPVVRDIGKWVEDNHLSSSDLLFPKRLLAPWDIEDGIEVAEGEAFTKAGRTYHHGTAYGYTGGGCRCEDCRIALRQYRRDLRRRNLSKRSIRPIGQNRTGHLANDQWRKVWDKAVKAAGLGWHPRTHDLRHACATHLLSSGISIYEVKEILGHRSIETTLKYQHRVDRMRSKAKEAMSDFLTEGEEV